MFLIPRLGRLISFKWAAIGLLILAGWEVYSLARPRSTGLDEPRRQVVEQAAWIAAEQLPELPRGQTVGVLPLAEDHNGHVTRHVRLALDRAGRHRQPDPGLIRRLMDELGIREAEVADLDHAVTAGRRLQVPYIVFGRVPELASHRGTGRIELQLQMVDTIAAAPVGDPILIILPERKAEPKFATWLWRPIAWLSFVVLLPLISRPLVHRVLDRESNRATGLLLAAYATAGWLAALFLMDFSPSGWWAVLLLVFAFGFSLVWSYVVFDTIDSRRPESV